MEIVETTAVYQYGSRLLVEIVGIDDQDEIASRTFELVLLDAANGDVTCQGEIPTEHEDHIRNLLTNEGYSLVEG